MTVTPDSLRSDLSALAGEQAKTDGAAERIKEGARERREAINTRLAALRHTVVADDEAGDEYQRLIAERGQLDIVLAS